MTLKEIKTQLSLENLVIYEDTDLDGKATGWWSAWDGLNRVSVSLHEDVKAVLKTSKDLVLNSYGQKEASNGAMYTKYVISNRPGGETF